MIFPQAIDVSLPSIQTLTMIVSLIDASCILFTSSLCLLIAAKKASIYNKTIVLFNKGNCSNKSIKKSVSFIDTKWIKYSGSGVYNSASFKSIFEKSIWLSSKSGVPKIAFGIDRANNVEKYNFNFCKKSFGSFFIVYLRTMTWCGININRSY